MKDRKLGECCVGVMEIQIGLTLLVCVRVSLTCRVARRIL